MIKCVNLNIELKNCSFVKTILMILVVLYHCMLFWSGGWFSEEPVYHSDLLPVIVTWLNTIHITGFTLVSGYIFYYIKVEKCGYQSFRIFSKKKLKRLIVPYLSIAILWAGPITLYFFKYSTKEYAYNILSGILPGHLWFLLMLFDVFILFYICYPVIASGTWYALSVAFLLLGLGIVGSHFLPNYFQAFTACRYFTFFLTGYLIRKYRLCFMVKGNYLLVMLFVHSLLLFTFFYLKELGPDSFLLRVMRILNMFVLQELGAVMAFFILQWVAEHILTIPDWFGRLGEISMPIYLIHQPVIYFSLHFLNGVIYPCVHVIVNFIFTMFTCVLIASVLMRYDFTRLLIGEKPR